MLRQHRLRLAMTLIVVGIALWVPSFIEQPVKPAITPAEQLRQTESAKKSLALLQSLDTKGRAPKTGYARNQFGNGWSAIGSCDTRNIILARDLTDERVSTDCKVLSGTLDDPYTGKSIQFLRGATTSDDVQIDHVVALSDSWQKGAQQLRFMDREKLANDPLNLLAVDGPANQEKSDGDAATWLPPNKPFRCQYISRQVSVKKKYDLWVTSAEKRAMIQILENC